MKKFVFTTAVALVLATGAYAQGHHNVGMSGGGGGFAAHGPTTGGGASFAAHGGAGFSAPRGMGSNTTMGSNRGPMTSLYNRAPTTMHSYKSGNSRNYNRFTERNQGPHYYDRYEGRNDNYEHKGTAHNFIEHGHNYNHHGVVGGNFYEHGRQFHFRRFWHGEWVFLNDWDDCAAWVWVHIAPGVWAWRPIDVCIG